jgi:thiol:disulfide interchange protein DsbD|nr:cytochrome c biogenesis protein CcdA [Candidatus Krumholzibacteria bacterium]
MTALTRRLLLLTLLTWSLTAAGVTQAADLTVTATPQDKAAVIGQDLVLHIDVALPQGTALALDQFQVEVVHGDGSPVFDEPYPLKPLTGPVAGSNPATYAGQVKLEWVATVLTEALPSEGDLVVNVTAGSDQGTWSAPFKVDFGSEWNQTKIAYYLEHKGMFLFLVLVFGFGLLMSLSPCIYPMIPITLAVIGAQRKEGTGLLQGLGLSLTYALGLALVYAAIGFIATTLFSGITAFMQSAWVMAPLAVLFLVLSLSMFGAYTLQAPAWLQNRLGGPGGGGRSGLIGVLLMGMVAGLVASPCVGPFLQALLLFLITLGKPLVSLLTLFVFGVGMSALLVAVGTFPSLLARMPQSGGWMETVNRSMGLLLVGMAFYFLRPGFVLPPQVFWPLAGVTTIIVAVFMGAFDRQESTAGWWDRVRKGLGLFAFLVGLYFLAGSFVQNGFMMASPWAEKEHKTPTAMVAVPQTVMAQAALPATATDTQPLPAKVPWTIFKTGENVQAALDEARALALAEGKPVMIDFWATWCVYCKKLDKMVWNVPEVVAESQRFVTIKIDATKPDDEEMTAIKELFKVAGLPRVVFIDSRGKILHGRSTGFLEAAEMLEIMKGVR